MSAVTMQDIAAELGVSVSTVSRALSGRLAGKSPVRDRVLDTAQRMGYKPARRRKTRSTLGRIALLALGTGGQADGASLSRAGYPGPGFYGQFVCGVERGIREANGTLRVHNIEAGPDLIDRARQAMKGIGAEATIILGGYGTEDIDRLCDDGTVVLLNIARQVVPADSVVPDDAGDVFMVVKRLVELGHRRIAFWVDRDEQGRIEPRPRQRLEGYRQAVQRFGLVFERTYHEAEGDRPFLERMADGFRAFLDEPERPTAIVTSADLFAYALLRFAHENRIAVPGELSIFSYDDMEMSAHVYPSLSSVNTNGELMGREAVGVLVRRMSRPEEPVRQIVMRGTLIERESSGPAKP